MPSWDKTWCSREECEHKKCSRHQNKMPWIAQEYSWLLSFADLSATEECEESERTIK